MTEPNEPSDLEHDQPEVDPEVVSDVDPDVAQEPVTLPDETHSRTTELAARLRQSALAQVEAARAALAPEDGESDQDAEPRARSKPESAIPALDDPRPAPPAPAPEQESEPEPDVEPEPEPEPESATEPEPHEIPVAMSEPVAVAAAAIAEAEAAGSESFLSGPAEPAASRSGGRVRLATVLAAVLTVAAVVVALVFWHASAHNRAVEKARAQALAAAKPEVAAALTYSYKTLDADFAKAEKGMSTKFRANYARTAASDVTPLATQTDASSTGSVTAAGVISGSADKVQILAFSDQVSTNKNLGGKNRLDITVIEVTMIKQGGRWVIDNLQPF